MKQSLLLVGMMGALAACTTPSPVPLNPGAKDVFIVQKSGAAAPGPAFVKPTPSDAPTIVPKDKAEMSKDAKPKATGHHAETDNAATIR